MAGSSQQDGSHRLGYGSQRRYAGAQRGHPNQLRILPRTRWVRDAGRHRRTRVDPAREGRGRRCAMVGYVARNEPKDEPSDRRRRANASFLETLELRDDANIRRLDVRTLVSAEVQQEIQQFLYREAELLDAWQMED